MINRNAKPRRHRLRAVRRVVFFGALVLVSTGAAAAELRGFISEGAAGELQYQFCNGPTLSRELYPIDDKTAFRALPSGVDAVRRIMLHRYRPLYVEVRGERGKTNASAYQFQRAVGTVESCKSLPRDIASNVRLLAMGEAPRWRLTVTDVTVVLELPDNVSIKLPAAAFKVAGTEQTAKQIASQLYEAQSADGKAVSIEVSPQMCTDNKSETAYGARVTVRIEKRILQGCASRF